MSRLMTLAVIVVTVAAAALLSVHFVSANALSASNAPIFSSLYRNSGTATPVDTNAPSGNGSGGVAPGNMNGPADQEASEPPSQDAQDAQEQELTGTVASIDSAKHAFVLTSASGRITVITTGQTEFEDGVSALGDLRTGMAVSVEGTRQSDGSIISSQTKGPSTNSENDGGNANSTSTGHD